MPIHIFLGLPLQKNMATPLVYRCVCAFVCSWIFRFQEKYVSVHGDFLLNFWFSLTFHFPFLNDQVFHCGQWF